jgi:hypothetical protein
MAGIGTLLRTFVVELVGPSKFPHTLLGRVIGGDDPTLQNLELIAKVRRAIGPNCLIRFPGGR